MNSRTLEKKQAVEAIAVKRPAVTVASLFWVFMGGSIIGFLLEGLWCLLRKGHWESHTATVWGPFCIIYGFGAAIMYLIYILMKKKGRILQFFCCMLAGTTMEVVTGVFQEQAFGTYSWDYSGHTLHIGKHISIIMSVIWGVLGITFIKLVFPHVEILLQHMQGNLWRVVFIVTATFMSLNLAVSCLALDRWNERHHGIPAQNFVDRAVDAIWDDEKMEKLYVNVKFTD